MWLERGRMLIRGNTPLSGRGSHPSFLLPLWRQQSTNSLSTAPTCRLVLKGNKKIYIFYSSSIANQFWHISDFCAPPSFCKWDLNTLTASFLTSFPGNSKNYKSNYLNLTQALAILIVAGPIPLYNNSFLLSSLWSPATERIISHRMFAHDLVLHLPSLQSEFFYWNRSVCFTFRHCFCQVNFPAPTVLPYS